MADNAPPTVWPPKFSEFPTVQEFWEAIGPMPAGLIASDQFYVGQPPVAQDYQTLVTWSLIWQGRHGQGGGPQIRE